MLGSPDWQTAPFIGLGEVSDPTPGLGLPPSPDPVNWYPSQSAWWKIRIGEASKCIVDTKATTGAGGVYLNMYVYTEEQLIAHGGPVGAYNAGDYVDYDWASGASMEVTFDVAARVSYYVQVGVEPDYSADSVQYVLTTKAVKWSAWVQPPNTITDEPTGGGARYFDSGDWFPEITSESQVIPALNEHLNIARVIDTSKTAGGDASYGPFVQIRGARTTETTPGQTIDDVFVGGEAAWCVAIAYPPSLWSNNLSPMSPYAPAGAIGQSQPETNQGQRISLTLDYTMKNQCYDTTVNPNMPWNSVVGIVPFDLSVRRYSGAWYSGTYDQGELIAHRSHDASGSAATLEPGYQSNVFGQGTIDLTSYALLATADNLTLICHMGHIEVQPRDGEFTNAPVNAVVHLRAAYEFRMKSEIRPTRHRWLVPADPIPPLDGRIGGGPVTSRRAFWGR